MAGERAVVTAEDHAAALALVEDWQDRHDRPGSRTTTAAQLELVGMIAAAIADGRARGERQARTAVADHLQMFTETLRSAQ